MRVRRLLPLVGLVALAAFLATGLPAALSASWKRIKTAGHDRSLSADESLARLRGPDYVAAIQRIREELPADSEYLLIGATDGADVFVRFDLAPRRAIFGGESKDIAHNVTPAKLASLPEWAVVPRLDGPGPRLLRTRLLVEKKAIP